MRAEPDKPSRDRLKHTIKAYWEHVATERRKASLWAQQVLTCCSAQDIGDVGAPSTAGSVSVQVFLPNPETPRKATRRMAKDVRGALTPKLAGRSPSMDLPMSAAKERHLTKPKRAAGMIGAGRKRLKEAKSKQYIEAPIVEEKPSTAGSDQDGDLLCMPGMEVGGACGALPPGTEDADLLPVFFLTAGS